MSFSSQRFLTELLIRQYQYKKICHIFYFRHRIFKGGIQDILHIISSVFPTRVFKKVSKDILFLLIFSHWAWGRLFVYDTQIILLVSKLAYESLLSRFCYASLR
jgi:hypothetical protein